MARKKLYLFERRRALLRVSQNRGSCLQVPDCGRFKDLAIAIRQPPRLLATLITPHRLGKRSIWGPP